MNHLKVKFSVDLNNPAQVEALGHFCVAIGATERGEAIAPGTQKPEPSRKKAPTKPAETKQEIEQPDTAVANMTVVDAQRVDPNETEAADDLLGAGQEAAPEIKLEDVRNETNKKVNPELNKNHAANAEKLRAKIRELGATKVNDLDPKHFVEFITFVKTLA